MPDPSASVLTAWSNFFFMTGSSAAALTGLMFVVITLVTGDRRTGGTEEGISTYSTPTVMHFCAALLVSAVLSAPWRSFLVAGVLTAIAGLYGVIYVLRVMYRASRHRRYKPDVEDWLWYSILPLLAYGAIFGGGIALARVPSNALFALASGVIALTFIGIRNAWDIVTFIATGGPARADAGAQPDEPG
jgi:hypothetical protein